MFTGPFLNLCLLLMSETLHSLYGWFLTNAFGYFCFLILLDHPSPGRWRGGGGWGRERGQRADNHEQICKRVSGSWQSWFYLLTVKTKALDYFRYFFPNVYPVQLEKCLGDERKPKETLKKIKIYICWLANPNPKSICLQWAITCPFSSSTFPEAWDRKCYLEHSRESTERGAWGAGRRGTLGVCRRPQETKIVSFIIRKRKRHCWMIF